jgi:carboxyl-terminal processing protease
MFVPLRVRAPAVRSYGFALPSGGGGCRHAGSIAMPFHVRPVVLALLVMLPVAAAAQTNAPVSPRKPAAVAAPPPQTSTAPPAPASDAAATEDIPLAEIRRYVQVYRSIRDSYVEPIPDQDLMRAALRGLLADIDPHSAYLEAEQARAFAENASGSYEGIGIETDESDPTMVKVIAPIDDTPAQRAGLRPGDRIVAIDGRAVDNTEPESDSRRLRGKPGTKVRVTLLRDGEAAPLEIEIQRETIRVTSVRSRMLEPGLGYVRLSTFQADTGEELR